jgi:hypothetical protein
MVADPAEHARAEPRGNSAIFRRDLLFGMRSMRLQSIYEDAFAIGENSFYLECLQQSADLCLKLLRECLDTTVRSCGWDGPVQKL